MRALLQMFTEMASARSAGFGSPQPIAWADMQAWAALTDTALDAFEVRVLRLLDATWLKAWADSQPKKAPARRGA